MQHQPSQKKVQFLFSFGCHRDGKDFEKAKKEAEKFKPHVYAEEYAFQTRAERKQLVPLLATSISRARNDFFFKRQLLDTALKGNQFEGFFQAELEYIIDAKYRSDFSHQPFAYPLEAHVRNFHSKTVAKHEEMKRQAIQLLYEGDIGKAISLCLDAEKLMAKSNYKRDRDIVQNMKDFAAEAVSLIPKLQMFNPLKVFVRLGHLHTPAYLMALKEYGKNSGFSIDRRMDDSKAHRFNPAEWIGRAYIFNKSVDTDWALGSLLLDITITMHSYRNNNKLDLSKSNEAVKVISRLEKRQVRELFENAARNKTGLTFNQWIFFIGSEVERLAAIQP